MNNLLSKVLSAHQSEPHEPIWLEIAEALREKDNLSERLSLCQLDTIKLRETFGELDTAIDEGGSHENWELVRKKSKQALLTQPTREDLDKWVEAQRFYTNVEMSNNGT